ncbi:MAG: response regulator, partial [Spirochaetales bacterium]|nr:response regulator [Spirochaetales bacterium]
IDEASDGEEAVSLISENNYDIILMDISMPNLNGIEATIRIRKDEEKNKHVPIIALTAHAFPTDRKKFIEVGMNDVLVKPLSETSLIDAILKYID